jgi:hypothetical protein
VPGLVGQIAGDVQMGTMIQANAVSTQYCRHKYSQYSVTNFQKSKILYGAEGVK